MKDSEGEVEEDNSKRTTERRLDGIFPGAFRDWGRSGYQYRCG
jgi:hypothetical protein